MPKSLFNIAGLADIPTPKRMIILALYLLAILFLAVFPISTVGAVDLDQIYVVNMRIDHIFHILAFIPAYPLMLWAFNPESIFNKTLLLLAATTIAFFAEYVQFYLSYRAYNTSDLLANMLGVLVGLVLVTIFVMVRWSQSDATLSES